MATTIKSENDRRDYRVISLSNGLVATLISSPLLCPNTSDADVDEREDEEHMSASDEDSQDDSDDMSGDNSENDQDEKCTKTRHKIQSEKMAAAALCVGVGSFSDPPDIPGLAHFLEHMVFMGSEKFPDENDFDAFVKKNGGNTNAYTDCERTVFYFDIERKHFRQALDKFAQFFISPLMKQDSVNRELKAIDSEFDMSKPSDTNRKQQLLGGFAKPGHPMSKFMWGNSQSLKEIPESQGVDVYERLQQFHQRMYSAHYMTLAIQSKECLDDLELWVKDIFSAVPHNGLPKPSFTEEEHMQPFQTDEFFQMYKVIPVKKVHEVELTWALPSLLKNYTSKPLNYIGWLIGHEGKGSILSYLKKRYWALSLSCGNGETGFEYNTTWASFTITIKMTNEGFTHLYDVLTAVFEYIAMLKKLGPQERIFKEIKIIEDNDYRWQEETDPEDYVQRISENMHLYPEQHFLCGDLLLFSYEPQLIEQCLNELTPDRMNIIISSESFEGTLACDRSEKWYETKFTRSDLSQELIQKWQECESSTDFFLPAENTYIATDFSLKETESQYSVVPVIINESSKSKLWFKKDDKFKVPKAYVYFHLISPLVNFSPATLVLMDIFIGVLKQNLAEVAYAADVAQLEYVIKSRESGIVLQVYGFNHKLQKLFLTLIDYIAEFGCDVEMFNAVCVQTRRNYHNAFIKPMKLVKDVRLSVLEQFHWNSVDIYNAAEDVDCSMLLRFVEDFKRNLYVEGLIQGNITASEAKEYEDYLLDKLHFSALPKHLHPESRVIRLPVGNNYVRVDHLLEDDDNCVITNYYQTVPVKSIRQLVVNEMSVMLMEEPCFDVLRTREQLGYAVFATNRYTSNVLGISITVQSQNTKYSMEYLDEKMNCFIEEFRHSLSKMTNEEFESQKKALITLKRCEDTYLQEEADRNWDEVNVQRYFFNRLEREIKELESISKSEVEDWYEKYVINPSTSRKLSCQVIASNCTANEVSDNFANKSKKMKPNKSPRLPRKHFVKEEEEIIKTVQESKKYDIKYLAVAGQNSIVDLPKFKRECSLYPIYKKPL